MSNLISDCCGANPWLSNPDLQRCGACKEWCEFIEEEEVVTDRQRKYQLASLMWTTCRIDETGDLTQARAKLQKRGLAHHEIEEIAGILIGMFARSARSA